MLLSNRKAYSMTFWAIFIGTVSVPILLLSIELSRYFFAKAEVAKAADAAALAAAIEINQQVFQETGKLVPTPATWSQAQQAVTVNSSYLGQKGITAYVTQIQVNDPADTVRVSVSANVSGLFPSFLSNIIITQTALAEVRAFAR